MKRVKIMLASITLVALLAGMLAFKAKNATFSLACLYQTTTTTTIAGGPVLTICRTLTHVDTTVSPFGSALKSVMLVQEDCRFTASTINITFCNNTTRVIPE